jgi:hypothetical protein
MSSASPPGSPPPFITPSLKRPCEDESEQAKKYIRNEISASLRTQIQESSLKEKSLELSGNRVKSSKTQFILPDELKDKMEIALSSAIPNPMQTSEPHVSPMQTQNLLAKMKSSSELSIEEWETIFEIAQSNHIPTIDFLLDSCILMLESLLKKYDGSATDLTSIVAQLPTSDRVNLFKCSNLMTRYGHLKSYLNLKFDNDDERIENARARFFLNICRQCPNIKSIEATCNEAENGEEVLEALDLFYADFTSTILPNLKQLVKLKLDIVSPVDDILNHLIQTINQHPLKFERISLRIFANPLVGVENTYHEDLELLRYLSPEKTESLSLLIEGDNTSLSDLSFLKEMPLHQISIEAMSGISNLVKENLNELSTYPVLEELILIQTDEEVQQFASTLPFKKITERQLGA